jgi:carbonic anhydrase
VKHIVVLGHARCGGIRAFAEPGDEPLSPGDFVGSWMALIEPAARSLAAEPGGPGRGSYLERLELAAIELSLANLMTFPCIRILVERGRLSLHGAYFGIATGQLLVRDPGTGRFSPVGGEALRATRTGCIAVEP